MTARNEMAIKALEYRIARQLLTAPGADTARPERQAINWGDRLIAIIAVTASLVVVGSFLGELIWAVLAAGTLFSLGIGDKK